MSRIENTPAFRKRLKELLEARNLSLADLIHLAAQKDIQGFPTLKTLRRWFVGETETINESSLIRIADALDLTYPTLRKELGLVQAKRIKLPQPLLVSIPIIVGLLLVFGGWQIWTALSPNNDISYLELSPDETRVTLKDETGKEKRVINLELKTTKPVLINARGKQYIVVGIQEQNASLDVAGHVIAYNTRGEEEWRFPTFDADFLKHTYRKPEDPESIHSGYFIVDWLAKAPFFGESREYVVVLASDPDFAPTRITILDPATGTDVYTFWNSGAINGGDIVNTGMKVRDFNGDESPEFLISGSLNKLTATIKRKLDFPIGDFLTAAWLVEPEKGKTDCAPALGCSNQAFEWLALSYPLTKLSSIDIILNDGTPRAKVGNTLTGLYNMVNYEGQVTTWFRNARWTKKHGDGASPPMIFLKGTAQGLKVEIQSEHPVHIDATLKQLYQPQEYQMLQEFFNMYGYEGS